MPHELSFATRASYDTRLKGITIEARLFWGAQSVICQAKIDTGGQACLFMREIADTLSLDLESGHRRVFNRLVALNRIR